MAEQVERVTTTETAPLTQGTAARETEVVKRSGEGSTVAARIIKFIAGIVIGLITLRFILLLLEANQNSGFVDFVISVTDPLVAPFSGIFGNPTDTVRVEPQSLVAIVVYALIAWGLVYLTRINRPRTTV